MRGKRFKEEQIISILKEAQAGISVADLCRKYGICSNTIYNWKAKYGGLTVSEVRRIRQLESQIESLWALRSFEAVAAVPKDGPAREERRQKVIESFAARSQDIANKYRDKLVELYGKEKGEKIRNAEAFELCEYGRQPSLEELKELFPFFEK